MQGWDHPATREALVMMDVFDLQHQVAAGKRKTKPHPGRPKKPERDSKQMGNAGGRSSDEVRAILAAMRDGTLKAPV